MRNQKKCRDSFSGMLYLSLCAIHRLTLIAERLSTRCGWHAHKGRIEFKIGPVSERPKKE